MVCKAVGHQSHPMSKQFRFTIHVRQIVRSHDCHRILALADHAGDVKAPVRSQRQSAVGSIEDQFGAIPLPWDYQLGWQGIVSPLKGGFVLEFPQNLVMPSNRFRLKGAVCA